MTGRRFFDARAAISRVAKNVLPAARLRKTREPMSAGLRRIDWRFVLPGPDETGFRELVAVGGDTYVDECLVATGTTQRVTRIVRTDGTADAFAIMTGGWVAPADVRRALAPGGVLWCEVDRREHPGLTPRRLERALAREGLTVVAVYWIRGGHHHPAMFIPVRLEAAVRWYFCSRFRARTPLRRVLRGAVLRAGRLLVRALLPLIPTFAVVARLRGDQDGSHEPPQELNSFARDPTVMPYPLLLTGGQGEWSRVALVYFSRAGGEPAAVFKVPRTATFNYATIHEQTVLREIRAALQDGLRESVPEPRGTSLWRGLVVGRESFVVGEALSGSESSAADRDDALMDLRVASAWLKRFHLATVQERMLVSDLAGPFEQMVRDYENVCGATPAERELFRCTLVEIRRSEEWFVPVVWEHRDLGPWNIYRSGHTVSVLDWEVARRGPGLGDLVYFVTHWLWAVRSRGSRHDRLRDLRALFLDRETTDGLAAAARQEIESYMQALTMPPGLLPIMIVYTFLDRALDRMARLKIVDPATRRQRASNLYAENLEALALAPQQLFGPPAS